MWVAVSSSKAVTSSLVQEEIRRDLAREVELRQEARRRLQEEDTSVDGEESEQGEERGRSKGRSQVVSQRSQSSRGERRRVYFGGSPVEETPRLAPSYTIYKEGGQGFTKYTVYAKQQQEQERKGMMNKKLQPVKRAVATTRPMEVQGKSSKIETGNTVCRYMPLKILHGSDIDISKVHTTRVKPRPPSLPPLNHPELLHISHCIDFTSHRATKRVKLRFYIVSAR